jgi:type III pantothenate kinase
MPTVLVIDAGNTQVKVGLSVGGRLEARFQLETSKAMDELDFAHQLRTVFKDRQNPEACLIASVVRGIQEPLIRAVQAVWSVSPLVVNSTYDLSIQVAVPNPESVGIDRLLEASEAFHLLKSGVIVAAFGSAITVDLLSEDRTFRGGVILPGLQTGLKALHNQTSLLPDLEVEAVHGVLGVDTATCMRSGVIYGAAGAVDRIYEELCGVAGKALPLVITGGDVSYVDSLLRTPHRIENDLVLRALVSLYGRLRQE